MEKGNPFLFNPNQIQQLEQLLQGMNEFQVAWLSGYLAGIGQKSPESKPVAEITPATEVKQISETELANEFKTEHSVTLNGHAEPAAISVLFGSRTGNGTAVANKLKEKAESLGIKADLKDMGDYPLNKLKDEKNLLVIVSTHGEGEPPIVAEEFYHFIHGKKAPALASTKYSVLALGDKSYVQFCKTGIEVDKRLEELGAQRVVPRVDCDVEFADPSESWINEVLKAFVTNGSAKPEPKLNGYHTPETPIKTFSKGHPYEAKLLDKIKLNGRSSGKETYHYEFSLENSGLQYEPGDALGIYPINSDRAVSELIETLSLFAFDIIMINDEEITLREALTNHYEISTLNPEVIANYNKYVQSPELTSILTDTARLKEYIYGRDVVDLVREFPYRLLSTELVGMLRKLQPRLYSIASSPNLNPNEIHITVATIRNYSKRYKEGVCSSFLADRFRDNECARVFIERNTDFRLPKNTDSHMIMVGPGTGIAPFRAFLQDREANGAKGKNWLFFGDRNFTTDFLYQTELQNYLKKGVLNKLHVAFSRDTDKKVYVQHKMLENSKELFRWLEEGAYFYVCGDMNHMWRDVNQTLLDIIRTEGGMTQEKAEDYLRKLKKEHRYQSDVY